MVMISRVPCVGETVCVHDGYTHYVIAVEHLTMLPSAGLTAYANVTVALRPPGK